eukprot:TRINITY_DN9312_c0_g1_i2.p1 TRINITY_DN9312_c0_g1~~TRINITY_DN9312_c0_g1_i2.p1  ORF type:complete len:256 (+),score=82.57 TRINITY_DN9312_c0_g1_i2:102-869(+)
MCIRDSSGAFYAVVEGYGANSTIPLEWTIGIKTDEVCDSGVDDDLDGLTDCDDVDDCFTDAACPYECPVDADVVFTDGVFTATGDFADLEGLLPYRDGEGCSGAQGRSQIWQMTIPAGKQLIVEEAQENFEDTVMHLLDDCMPSMDCIDSGDTPSQARASAGDTERTVYAVMQAWSTFNTSGTWTVTATLVDDEDCTTDVDEDLDGDIGCDDSDCAMDAACFELDCTDGVSGDDDDLVDCMDPVLCVDTLSLIHI